MKCRPRQLVAFLLGGALINIVVAYFCLIWQQLPRVPQPWRSASSYWHQYAASSAQHGQPTFEHLCGAIGCDFFILDASLYTSPTTMPANYAPPRMMITRAGFPFRCLEGMHSWGPVTPSYSWGIPLTPTRHNVSWVSILPCKPLFIGFFINSALYGMLLWLPMKGPLYWIAPIRRHENRRQGLCPDCGYDLRGSDYKLCPECGANASKPS